MTIFCLDTSTRAGSIALWRDGHVASVVHADARSHAERLPVEALEWLTAQGVTLGALDAFAVVAGPGSFTGLRVGVAACQGWALATGTPVIAVPTLDAVANEPSLDDPGDALVIPAIDGQRSEVFFAVRRRGVEVRPAAAARPMDAVAAVAAAFPGVPAVAVGDATDRYGAVFEAAGWTCRERTVPLAESAVRLAASGRYPQGTPHALRPIYVRRPDAEVAREKRDRRS